MHTTNQHLHCSRKGNGTQKAKSGTCTVARMLNGKGYACFKKPEYYFYKSSMVNGDSKPEE